VTADVPADCLEQAAARARSRQKETVDLIIQDEREQEACQGESGKRYDDLQRRPTGQLDCRRRRKIMRRIANLRSEISKLKIAQSAETRMHSSTDTKQKSQAPRSKNVNRRDETVHVR